MAANRSNDEHARANRERNTSGSPRDKYRGSDNDDERAPLGPDDRNDVKSDSKSEARGTQRDNVGNHSRGTASSPRGPEANDKTRREPQS